MCASDINLFARTQSDVKFFDYGLVSLRYTTDLVTFEKIRF